MRPNRPDGKLLPIPLELTPQEANHLTSHEVRETTAAGRGLPLVFC